MQQDHVTIETPEHVEFSYELAGLGSRFLAVVLDTFFLWVGLFVVATIFFYASLFVQLSFPSLGAVADVPIMLLIIILAYKLIRMGYFIVFEIVWEGQSPGKRIAGMRVIRSGGGPIGFAESATRNILRLVDDLPILSLFGGLFVFFTRACQRIGDLAAGTIVVKERLWEYPGTVTDTPETEVGTEAAIPPGTEAVRRARGHVASLSREQIEAIRRFLGRRDELAPEIRRELAAKIAAPLREQFAGVLAAEDVGAERLLEVIYQAHLERQRSL